MAKIHNQLVLNKYMLHLLGVSNFEVFSKELNDSTLEGYTEEGNTRFLDALLMHFSQVLKIPKSDLKRYDENIVRHTQKISQRRKEVIKWKYFQYLSLLFTEIYLDLYFKDKDALLVSLNSFLTEYNAKKSSDKKTGKEFLKIVPFTLSDLNKLAFWSATGSGKTLLMHINILQYMHYLDSLNQFGGLNKIILITPNQGLSNQHCEEFVLSNIQANRFSKQDSSMFSGRQVEILEITKLDKESGDLKVAVDSFETNNLVLIDEGHGGMGGEKWKPFRDQLSEEGFAFEYSATFGQAINAVFNKKQQEELIQEYAKSILFDYSYKFFYGDGYGKEYRILNMKEDNNETFLRRYLTANLLSFYQQILLFHNKADVTKLFNIHKPLWVFVGGKVNAVRTQKGRTTSDVLDIIYFLTNFIKKQDVAIDDIRLILEDKSGLVDKEGNSIFANFFNYIHEIQLDAKAIYKDINKRLFNSDVLGANLYLDDLKGVDGELGLRVGDNDYFGVINVGDETKLYKLALENGALGTDKDFSTSLFQQINNADSKINLLIGSKKFTEGWSSWRVSSMGLMNMGKSEGSQVIQLFGRGVRLKGYQFSLKRLNGLDEYQKPQNKRKLAPYILPMETLNIFGVRADYMQQFKEFLDDEGLPSNSKEWVTYEVPSALKKEKLNSQLKIIEVDNSYSFKRDVLPLELRLDLSLFKFSKIEVDLYAKVEAMAAEGLGKEDQETYKTKVFLSESNYRFLDWNKIYIDILNYKVEKHYSNLSISQEVLRDIIENTDWYILYINKEELVLDRFDKIYIWYDIVLTLLKKYIDYFYNYQRNKFNAKHIDTRVLSCSDDNFIKDYKVQLNPEKNIDNLKIKIENYISSLIKHQKPYDEQLGEQFHVFDVDTHLYKPLFYSGQKTDRVKVVPVALNEPEYKFVHDLTLDCEKRSEFYLDKQVYLLRNLSKKGLGFFTEGNNFYPDFILWIIYEGKQYLTFIDPKGIRNSYGLLNDPKIQFYNFLKDSIQPQVEANLILNSFIISNTSFMSVHWREDYTKYDFNHHHVLFQEDPDYIEQLIYKILN